MGFYLRKTLRLGPLHVNLSTSGVGLSAGVRGGRFGVDALGHPYVHAGRGGIYYRRRWPAATAEPSRLPPEGPPPVATHGRIGWGWLVGVGLLLVVVARMLRI